MHVEVRLSRYLRVSKPERHVCMRARACMYVCMYVRGPAACMYGCLRLPTPPQAYISYVCMSENPEHVCMYVCLTGPQASMYVCLRLLSKYVCMSHSKLQNEPVSEGVKFLIKTLQNLTFNSFFFEL